MISIVIPTFNNLEYLKLCINSIKKRNTDKFQRFFEFSRDLYYQKFFNDLKSIYNFDPNIRYVR